MELFWKLLISLLIVEISGQIQTQKAQLYITYPISGKVKLYIDATERAILAGVLKAQELLPTVVIRNDYFASVNDNCDQTTAFQLLISDFLGHTTNVNDNVGPGYLDVIIGISCNQVCRPIANFYGSLLVPVISVGCDLSQFASSSLFHSFFSLTPSSSIFLGIFPILIMEYGWPSVTIIQTNDIDWIFLGNDIRKQLAANAIQFGEDITIENTPLKDTMTDDDWNDQIDPIFVRFQKLLNGTSKSKSQKVFILLMHDTDVLSCLLAAAAANIADPVFITVGFIPVIGSQISFPKHRNTIPSINVLQRRILVINPNATSIVNTTNDLERTSVHSQFMYDAIVMWATAVQQVFNESMYFEPLRFIKQEINDKLRNLTEFQLDDQNTAKMENGSRLMNFRVDALTADLYFKPIHYYDYTTRTLSNVRKKRKLDNSTLRLSEEQDDGTITLKGYPLPCGWDNEQCSDLNPEQNMNTLWIILGVLGIVLLVFIIVLIFCLRHRNKKRKSNRTIVMAWLLKWSDVINNSSEKEDMITPQIDRMMNQELNRVRYRQSDSDEHDIVVFGEAAYCKGYVVNIKRLDTNSIDIDDPNLYLQLSQLIDLKHENLNRFIGIIIEYPHIAQVSQYAKYGSLQDVLDESSNELSIEFKISFALDIAKGLEYLGSSELGSYGYLSSYSVVVDKKWLCKLNGYGLGSYRYPPIRTPQETAIDLLWTAPELVRMTESERPMYGTQRGDIYSYGIILQQIANRGHPFSYKRRNLEPEGIIVDVKNNNTLMRPIVRKDACSDSWRALMMACWAEQPEDRPVVKKIIISVRKLSKGKSINIVDNMLEKLEKHTKYLEKIVDEKNDELAQEKKNLEKLLYNILPKIIAENLMHHRTIEPETFESVSVFFSDIVRFKKIGEQSSAFEVVDLLNKLYSAFDAITDRYNVYKCETIGDVYMVASGLPVRYAEHASELTTMALHLLSVISSFKIPHMPNEMLQLRIGIHSGPVVAGIVGVKMPHYCLFGDTVNTAARMQTGGLALHIHVSDTTANQLKLAQDFELQYRGERDVKGKGTMKTYFVLGKTGFNLPMPDLKYAARESEHEFK